MLFEQAAVLWSFTLMAIALSMDAFSVSLSIGLQNIRLKRVVLLGIFIGGFHCLLPFIGIVLGNFISLKMEVFATIVGGVLLVFIGLFMFFSAFAGGRDTGVNLTGIRLLTISFAVSVDSFPVGLGLGILGLHTIIIIFMFGITSMVFAWLGMLIGKKVHNHLSKYSEIFGGLILFGYGIRIIFF